MFHISPGRLIAAGLIIIIALAVLPVMPVLAANCTSQAAGNWSATGTWSCGQVPTATDDVIIANGNTVTLDTNATVSSLTVADGGTATALTISGTNSLTVTNNVNIGTATGSVAKSVDVKSGILTVGGNLNLLESATSNRLSQLTIDTGTVTINGNIYYAANGTLTNSKIIFNNTGTLNVAGNFPPGITLTTFAGSTVNFNGAAQTIPNYTYKVLSLTGSGVKTIPVFTTTPVSITLGGTASATTAANLTIAGSLVVGSGSSFAIGSNYTLTVPLSTSVSGTLTLGGTGAKTFTGDVTINSGGIWNETGSGNISDAGSLTNAGTYIANTGAHTFSGANKTITATNMITIPTLTLTGATTLSGGTLNITTALSNSAAMTVAASGVIIAPTLTATSGITNNGGIYAGTMSVATTALTNNGWINATTSLTIGIASTNAAAGIITTPAMNLNAVLTNNGTLNVTTSMAGGSTLTNNATGVVNYGGGTPFAPGLTVTAAGNIVSYNGAGTQTVKVAAYSNLILSGSGAKTMNSGTSVSAGGDLNITGSASASIQTGANLTVDKLALGGVGKAASSWGSSTSTATNKDDTYFALSTGKLAVTAADTKLATTVSFGSTPTPTFLGGNFTASATTSPNTGSMVYSVVSGPCVQSGANSFIPTGGGVCRVQAYSAATALYEAAYATQDIPINKASQAVLTVSSNLTRVVQGNTVTLSSSGGSGTGAVTYSVGPSTGCTVAGSILTATDGSGTCSVTATRAADSQYLQAISTPLSVVVTSYQIEINKNFSPANIQPGGISTLSITLYNQNAFQLVNTAYSDDLLGVQPGISIAGSPVITNNCGGSVTANPGGTLIALSGGSVPAKVGSTNGQCTVTVTVTSSTAGNLTNTIPVGAVSANKSSGELATNNTAASVTLVVATVLSPTVDKNFNLSTIYAGATSTLTININNQDASSGLTHVNLTDSLPSGVVIANPPTIVVSGSGCTATASNVTATAGVSSLTFSSASAGIAFGVNSKCTIKVNVTSLTQGSYINTIPSRAISTDQGVSNLYPAEATLNVQQLNIAKVFAPATIVAGGVSTATITIYNPTSPAYTGITLTDNLPSGMVVSGIPASPQCITGVVSYTSTSVTITNGSTLSGGTPASTKNCVITFNVTTALSQISTPLNNIIPGGSLVDDNSITNPSPVTTPLNITPAIAVSKTMSPAGITIGNTSTVTITLTNNSTTALSNVSMTDNMPVNLVPYDVLALTTTYHPCNGGSVAYDPGLNRVTLTGGAINASSSCTVTFPVTSSIGSALGTTYTNAIAAGGACFDNGSGPICNPTASGNATVKLYTSTLPITGTKVFGTPNIAPGGTSTLIITVTAPSDSGLSSVSETDNLPAGVTTTAAVSTKSAACVGGAQASGSGLTTLTYTGGSIAAGAVCTLTWTVTSSTLGLVTNTIPAAQVSGVDSNTITRNLAAPLTASLNVSNFLTSYAFYPPTVAQNGLSVLTITLTNPNTTTLTNLILTDTFPAGITVAPTPNASTDCGGTLTTTPGANSITLNGSAGVPARVGGVNGICTINVTVKDSNSSGSANSGLINTNVNAYLGTLPIQSLLITAANITISPMTITVNKTFDKLTVTGGSASTMRITLTNPNIAPLTGIAFTDTMPSGMYIAFPANLNTGACGGSLAGVSGSNILTYSQGSLAAAPATCDLTLSVSMNSNGNLTNTIPAGAVTTAINATNTQDASATLTNLGGVSVHKAFSPSSIPLNSISSLTLIIQNTGNFALNNLAGTLGSNVLDILPPGLEIASNTSVNNCGGSLTATAGTNTIAIGGANSLAAYSSCTIIVPITGSATGTFTNTIPINTIRNDEGQSNSEIGQDSLHILDVPGFTTTPNPGSDTVGVRLLDNATLSGGASPTGSVTFKLFAPSDTTCSGAPIYTETSALTGLSAATVTGFASNVAGTWHWIAIYNGDANNSSTGGVCSDEPVVVSKSSPTITTSANPTTGIVGVAIASDGDSATSLGSAYNPTGLIHFTLYSDSGCNTAVPSMTGNGTITGGFATWSASWTPTLPGTYYWKATYAGDTNNNAAASACGGTNEQVLIAKSSPAISTAASEPVSIGSTVNDVAHLSGGYGAQGGTLSFNIYAPGDAGCATPITVGSLISVSGAGDYSSANYTTTALGDYRWRAFYSGDTNNNAVSTACNESGETSTVVKVSPTLTTAASGPVSLGQILTDRAHLAGIYGALTGTISFDIFAPGDSTCSIPIAVNPAVAVSGSGDYTSANYSPLSAGDYRWIASYSGDAYNNGILSSCNDIGEISTVNNIATPILTTNASGPVNVGADISDTAHLSGGSGPLTGTLAFNVYVPTDETCSSPISVDTSIIINDAGDYTSSTYTTTQAGSYRWRAFYSGDADNNAVSTGCYDADESSVVNQATPTLTTTASGPVTVGAGITDTAHLSGGYGTLTGTISFNVYAPGDITCGTPTAVTPAVSASGSGNYTSAGFTSLAAGTYRWRAYYSGNTNNAAVSTACNDLGEISTVNQAMPILTTTASGPVTVGANITDTAHLSAGYGALTGTISFNVYAPGDATCGTPTAVTPTVSVNGSGNYTSAGFATLAIGNYRWRAFYSGDANNNAVGTACNDSGEASTVNQAMPTLTTASSGPVSVGAGITDTAHLSGGYGTLGGTISFNVYAPGDTTCSTPTAVTPGVSVSGTGSYTSAGFTTLVAGIYRWRGYFSGDTNNAAVSTACNDSGESSVVNQAVPTLTTTASGPVTLGASITDTAHLSGGFGALSGTVTFNIYAPGDIYCFTPAAVNPGRSVSGTGSYTSAGFTTLAAGTYRWRAYYSGNTNNAGVSTACNDSGETSTVNQATPTLTTTASGPVTVGTDITDTANLSGGYGTLGGTITFNIYAPGDINCFTPAAVNPGWAVSGSGSYTSAGFTTQAAGTYRWRAYYSGDTNNAAVSSTCNDSDETSTVNQATPTFTTTASGPVTVGSSITDTAQLSGGYGTLGGTVSFSLYAPDDSACTTALTPAPASAAVNGANNYTSGNFTTSLVGSYRWIAHYSGDSNNNAVNSACVDVGETSIVNKATPILTTTASGPVKVGDEIIDTAHLIGGYDTLTGSLSFSLYSPADMSCATALTPAPALAVVNGVNDYLSGAFTTATYGSYRWIAHYSGDSFNNSVDTGCNDLDETSVAVSIVATHYTGNPVNGLPGGQSLSNVLVNDTLDGGQAVLSNVNLTQVSTTDDRVTLNVSDGSVNVAPGTDNGFYTLTYQICDTAYPGICATNTVDVQVSIPTAVLVSAFDAARINGSQVQLDWQTFSEVNMLGFNIYRSNQEGTGYSLINKDIITAHDPGSIVGSNYTFVDPNTIPGVTYYYRLDVVQPDLNAQLAAETKLPGFIIYMPAIKAQP